MTAEIVQRVLQSRRYRAVDPALVGRIVDEELPRARSADDAVKRVKRRLHQAVGAFDGGRPATGALARAWRGDLVAPAFRAACLAALRSHASTRERAAHLERFYPAIWERTGVPGSVLDLGCGLAPLALPWMNLDRGARYVAVDADRGLLDRVDAFLELVGQPHETRALDLVAAVPEDEADVALVLKLVTTLDRQDPSAATRLLTSVAARHAVVSFTTRSLGGHARGMERTYRSRMERLAAEVPRVTSVTEASVPTELVFVLRLEPSRG
jgi:16S rRNA (guanine(1405)-N(7))-methyltransferase